MGTCDTNSNRNLRPLIRRCDCSQFCFYDDVSVLESYNHRRSLSICCIDRNNDRGRQRNYNAYQMADQILIILSIVMVGMSYQMPTGIGIIKGGGDVKYMMYLNLISTWAIVMPLSFLGAFVWKLPVPMVVLLLNSDQLFKCIPTYLYVKKDKWIKVLV